MKTKIILLLAALLALGAGTLAVTAAAPTAAPPKLLIAYSGIDHNIWTILSDGSARTKLTTDRLSDSPAWAAGRLILFQTQRDGFNVTVGDRTVGLNQIYSMSPDGSGQTRLSDSSADDKFPDVLPGANRVVFIRVNNYRVSDGKTLHNTEIGAMNLSGGGGYRAFTTLTSDANTSYDLYPARQSPDGTKIVFVKRTVGESNRLMLLDPSSGTVSSVAVNIDANAPAGTVEYLWPRFAPNGDIVVVRRVVNGNVDLLRITQAGAAQALFTQLTYEALAYGFDVFWDSNTVIAARSPEVPGGMRPEELYWIDLTAGTASAPLTSGHQPAAVAAPPPPTDTPTVTPTPTNTATATATFTVTPIPLTATPAPATALPGQPTFTPLPPTPSPTISTAPLITTADPLFYSVWERTDRPVLEGRAQRSWTWGPKPFADGHELYGADTRLVQYFDKARMELNPATGVRPAFVTNGLLVVELMSGQIQIGPDQYTGSTPSNLPIGGDGANNPAPSYAALAKVASLHGENQAPSHVGVTVTASINSAGDVSGIPAPATVTIARFAPETGHNIPDVFWSFLNQSGTIYSGGYGQGQVLDWLFTVGYPLSEPYWTKMSIAGQPTDVLVQAYQRQVLTYLPSYDAPWRVQFANVGQVYFKWRYNQ